MKNKIYITNEQDDVSIEMTLSSDSATSPEQLMVRSVKALLRTMDVQDYMRHGKNGQMRFAADLDEIARTLHDVAASGGWRDAKE
jgi:hypothetical protein